MPTMGSKGQTHELKATGSPKPTLRPRRTKKSEDTTSEVIDIMKPDNDKGNLQPKYKDLQLQVSIPLERTQLPVIELGKVNPAEGRKDMPPPDSQEFAITTPAPDEETQAVAETLESLQRHQGTESS